MTWNYLRYPDDTQIAYSDLRPDGTIEVTIERPIDYGFDTAVCLLPSFRWTKNEGFSPDEMEQWDAILKSNAPLIFELAEEHEVANA